MTSVYLAARWERQAELQGYRYFLVANGFTVTSSWLDVVAGSSLSPAGDGKTNHDHAMTDLADVGRADVFVLFTESEPQPRGGRLVEFGYAISQREWDAEEGGYEQMRIYVVGPRENLFCHLDFVIQCDTWADCVYTLAKEHPNG